MVVCPPSSPGYSCEVIITADVPIFVAMPDLENTILNDVLCLVATARDSLSQNTLVMNALAFYTSEAVKNAKEIICKITNERIVKQKACT